MGHAVRRQESTARCCYRLGPGGPRTDGYGLAWTFEAKGRILAGPVVRGNAIYIGDDLGNLYRLEATD